MTSLGKVLAIGAGLFFSLQSVHAQAVLGGSFVGEGTPTAPPDSLVQLVAESQGLDQIAPSDLPAFGTYWLVLPGGVTAPLPCPPYDETLPIYQIADGQFLVDQTGGQVAVNSRQLLRHTATLSPATAVADAVSAETESIVALVDQIQTEDDNRQLRTMALSLGMDVPSLGGDGTNGTSGGFTANDLISTPIDHGTNLWIAQVSAAAGSLSGIGTNTLADMSYEIQSRTNLTQVDWQSEGFILGSEITNWTHLSVPQLGRTNLFIRLKSWSADGSGLPIWWQLQYFGTNGVNPNAQDAASDGWTIYQKFQMGLNPNTPTTPPPPQGLSAIYNVSSGEANVSWVPSPGPVTGYTVTDSDGNTFNVSASADSLVDNISSDTPDPWNEGNLDTTFQIQAHYGSNNSPWAGPVSVEKNMMIGSIVPGAQGTAYLAVSALPPNTAVIRLTVIDYNYLYFIDSYDSNAFTATYNIPISDFTNGLYQLPNDAVLGEGDNLWNYNWYGQAVGTNGLGLTATTWLTTVYTSPQDNFQMTWLVPPFFDGRTQLKQNLIFQLRAALADRPFQYTELYTNYGVGFYFVSSPTNYAYAGYFNFSEYYNGIGVAYEPYLDTFLPFEENYFDRNFVFNSSYLNSNGRTTTGVGGEFDYYGSGGLTIQTTGNINNYLELPLAYEFVAPTTNGATISSVLATNQTRWLSTYPVDSSSVYLTEIGITNEYSYSPAINAMFSNARNWFGLQYLSAEIGYAGPSTTTLYAGGNTTQGGYFYPETAQPRFQIVGYDYWMALDPFYSLVTNGLDYPGMAGLSTTHTNPVLITSVGNSGFKVACFAKLAVTNSAYSGVYGYMQQYFDQAYQIDTNGYVTANTTGILSPYGSFFATQPGTVALVTMPDVDTGQRGTNTVYAINLSLDANRDGTIDPSFSGRDNTTTSSPYAFWANNNYDRFVLDSDDNAFYDDDVHVQGCPYTPDQNTPDCNFLDGAGHRVIPCARDLQDFARLWVCGVTSNLLANLPAGSTVTLNWGDVGGPNSGNPTIDLFTAADPDGGIGYLTNSTTADSQIDSSYCPYIGRLGPGSNIVLNASTFTNNWAGNHFIWCGVGYGTGRLNLTIADSNGNTLAQATTDIQIVDIKQMYERWTVGDLPNIAPLTNAILAADDGLPIGAPAFNYAIPQNTNTPYIVYVHGWNMEIWEKDRFAESAFKRLFWQGYQGRFGSFRWPTYNGFTGSYWQALTDTRNYDNSEFIAWQSAAGLLNTLTNLNAEYSGKVYLLAHSMGNIVAGEALRLAGNNQVANTYVASQSALPAHDYDATVTTPYLLQFSYRYPSGLLWAAGTVNYGPDAPNIYGNFLATNASAVGRRISFFNTSDFALAAPRWCFDQITKPDYIPPNNFYYYAGSLSDSAPWNLFYDSPILGGAGTLVDIVTNLNNHYKIMAYGAESHSTALGATPGITNVVNLNLTTVWPTDTSGHNYGDHFWHSAEFRGDCWQEWNYWNTLLFSSGYGFNISIP